MDSRANRRDRRPLLLRHRAARRVGFLLLALALVAGCSSNSGVSGVPTVSGSPDAGLTGVRAPSTETGGTLRIVAGAVDSLDPQRSYSPGVWDLMRLYTRTLVTWSTEPGHTDELVPDLATDLGSTDDGGKTWTFHLREGVTFSGGAEITSEDVKYGIERSFASDVVVGGPTYVVGLLDDPDDPYAGPYQDTSKNKLGLSAIKTPDDSTIVFKLRRAEPDFGYVLALPSSSPVPRKADTGKKYGSDPVSSGPYQIASIDAQTGITFERNPDWDPATDDVRTALPDSVVVRTDLSGVARDQALLAGSADLDISGTGLQTATSRAEDESTTDRTDDVTTGGVRLLALPTSVAPMDDAECRAAVAAVVDRTAVQQVLGGGDSALRTSVLWPRGVAGGPDDPDPGPDLAAARAHLAACGKPDGFSTVLAVSDVPTNVSLGQELAAELAQVGITAEVTPLPADTYYASDIGSPKTVDKQGYGIVLALWTADFPTPASFLQPLVDGDAIRDVGNTNYAELDDEDLNSQVDDATKSGEVGAWNEVSSAAAATDAYVPLAENRVQLVAGQRLRNGVVMQPYGAYDVATAGVR